MLTSPIYYFTCTYRQSLNYIVQWSDFIVRTNDPFFFCFKDRVVLYYIMNSTCLCYLYYYTEDANLKTKIVTPPFSLSTFRFAPTIANAKQA